MHDQIELDRPLERAVQAIEHVIRYQGAPHLRPASCRLSMLERESVDVTLFLLLLTMALSYISFRIFRSTTSKLLNWTKIDGIKKNQWTRRAKKRTAIITRGDA